MVIMIDSREQSHVDKGLEPIANPDDQLTIFDKLSYFVPGMGVQPHSLNHTSPMIVSPAETTAENEDLIVIKGYGLVNNGIYMDAFRVGACQLKHMGGFIITIQSIAG